MKPYKQTILIFLLSCLNGGRVGATAIEMSFINEARIDRTVAAAEADGFVGVVGISTGHHTLYVKGIGQAVSGTAPYTGTTVVDSASVTKQFTGAAILKLAEAGRLNLNDTLGKYFPKFGPDMRDISLHQLLTHTAGFRRALGRDEESISKEAFVSRAAESDLVKRPGEEYHYSNVGYSLLAMVVEAASGQSYEDYLFASLWQPAGMFATGYNRPDWSGRVLPVLPEPFKGYKKALDILQQNGADNWHLTGNGGVLTTAEDMLKWHRALSGDRILSKASKEKLFAAHVPEEDAGYFYGYGWSIVPQAPQGKLIWHNGMSYFGKAEFWRFPDSGIGIFVASHTGDYEPSWLAEDIAAAVHEMGAAQ